MYKIVRKENVRHYSLFETIMREKIGTKVKISNKKIEIPFDSEKDLERILEILNIEIKRIERLYKNSKGETYERI